MQVGRWVRRTAVLALAAAAGGGGATVAATRYDIALPPPAESVTLPAAQTVPGTAPAIPLPAQGAFALKDSVAGPLAGLGADVVRPMASITKTMTALAVLDARPLAVGADGPSLTVTAADVTLLHQVIAADGTHVVVHVGERLTERELLEGMMLPSANNFAIMLGRWVDGDDATFVERLNTRALGLGMTHTHFDDADGLSAATVSTANDLLLLGSAAIAQPALSAIMLLPRATLADGTVMVNIDALVGTVPGWLGIKTGHTDEAGYCLLFAARRDLGDGTPPLTIVGVVLAQHQRSDSLNAARLAVEADTAAYVPVSFAGPPPGFSGRVTTAWGGSADLSIPSGAAVRSRLVRRGEVLTTSYRAAALAVVPPAGTAAGTLTVSLRGVPVVNFDVVTRTAIAAPDPWWRLRR